MEENTREVIISRMRKEVVGFFQSLVVNKKLLVKFEYGQNKYMSSSLLQFLCLKEEVGMNEPKSNLTRKEQGE